ncbi:MAG TPA: hypothetical protein VGI10_07165 [Polyangiaceae bacterium]|jgi:hypothetical protein
MSEDSEHDELKRLFDETADRPSGPTLTKLAARAIDAPARAGRAPRFLPSWAFSPAVAGVALAVAAALALVLAVPESAPPARTAASVLTASVSVPAPPVLSPPAALANGHATPNGSALLNADVADSEGDLGLGLDDTSEGSSFNVSGPESDQDLDAWLAASKALAEGS